MVALALRSGAAVIRRDHHRYRLDEEILEHNRAMLGPFGVAVDEDIARSGRNWTYTELAEATLVSAAPEDGTPDLVVVAYALPDLHPLKTVSSHLNHLLGGTARSFAVSEYGLAAPYAALRIASAYARSGRCASLALFVLEQTTLPYHEPFLDDLDLSDSAVYLHFTAADGITIGRITNGDDLATVLADVVPPTGRTLIVAGPWTDAGIVDGVGATVRRVANGSYATGVWTDLADHHAEWCDRYDAIVLCDTDPRTGLSHAAVLHREMTP
jgi:hypothetical protein